MCKTAHFVCRILPGLLFFIVGDLVASKDPRQDPFNVFANPPLLLLRISYPTVENGPPRRTLEASPCPSRSSRSLRSDSAHHVFLVALVCSRIRLQESESGSDAAPRDIPSPASPTGDDGIQTLEVGIHLVAVQVVRGRAGGAGAR